MPGRPKAKIVPMTAAELARGVKPKRYKGAVERWPNERLIEARRTWGLAQGDVARAMGITRNQLTNLELGAHPSLLTALRLARFYESTVETLFGWIADEQEDDAVDTVHEGTGETGLSSAVAGWPHGDPCAGRGQEEVAGEGRRDAG